jgi:hypothetical protein
MMTDSKPLRTLEKFSETLKSELNSSIKRVLDTADNPDSLWIKIPDDTDADLSQDELAKIVIKTANTYIAAARFNGMIKAELGKAEGLHKQRFRTALANDAKNAEGREAIATSKTEEEWASLQLIRYIAEISEAAERAARIASESARKLLDKASNVNTGEARAHHGAQQTAIDTGF